MKDYKKIRPLRKTVSGILFILLFLPITAQEIDTISANEYFKQSILALKEDNFEKCRSLALKTLDVDSSFGEAYIVMGQAYVASREQCFEEYYKKAIVFCLAVDMFELAKKVDSSLTERSNELIRVYSKYFPSREESWSDLKSGQEYEIGCWINEKTTVRFYEDIY